jgi:hypothetical protein
MIQWFVKVDGNVYEETNLYTPQINTKSSEIAQLSEIRMRCV